MSNKTRSPESFQLSETLSRQFGWVRGLASFLKMLGFPGMAQSGETSKLKRGWYRFTQLLQFLLVSTDFDLLCPILSNCVVFWPNLTKLDNFATNFAQFWLGSTIWTHLNMFRYKFIHLHTFKKKNVLFFSKCFPMLSHLTNISYVGQCLQILNNFFQEIFFYFI